MAQEFLKNPIVDLSAGLITEQTPFTLAPNATSDELNCVITSTGARARRKGLVFEQAFDEDNDYAIASEGSLIHSVLWPNAGDVSSDAYLVVQSDNLLYLYTVSDVMDSAIVQGASTVYTIDLNTYQYNNLPVEDYKISGVEVNGLFIVTSPAIYPFYIKVDSNDADGFSEAQINVQARDFKYLGDTSTYFAKANLGGTATVAKQRRMYDTINSGWTEDTIDAYATHTTTANDYPPLTHRWYGAKDSSGDFDPALWEKTFGGSSIVGNGRIILDVLERNRVTAYNALDVADSISTTYVPNEIEPQSFSYVTSYAGRVVFSGLASGESASNVYVSKVIERPEDLGICYQVFDPTAEEFSDLLPDDGVVIRVSGCSNVKSLMVFQNDLLVFSGAGCWAIRGVDGQFTSDSFFVERITSEGVPSRFSVSEFKSTPVVFGNRTIYSIQKQPNGSIVTEDLSEKTIKSYLDAITPKQKSSLFSVVDEIESKIYWVYRDDDENLISKYNNILIFDLRFGAFIPWRVSDFDNPTGQTSYIASAFSYGNSLSINSQSQLLDDGGDDIIDDGGDFVTVTREDFLNATTPGIKFVCFWNGLRPTATNSAFLPWGVRFANFRSASYQDWFMNQNVGVDYQSFMETSYNVFTDLHNDKTVDSINVYHKIVDYKYFRDFDDDLGGASLYFSRPNLTVKLFWDFKNTTDLSDETFELLAQPTAQETPPSILPWTFPNDYTYKIVRAEGRGKILNLRFESVNGSGFEMIGFETVASKNREYDNFR